MSGLHEEEQIGRSSIRWTTGEADFEVTSPNPFGSVVVVVARVIPPGVAPVRATVWVDEVPARHFEVPARKSRLEPPVIYVRVPLTPPRTHVRVRVGSETFVPSRDLGWPDDRTLGLPLLSPGVCVGSAPRVVLQCRAPSLVTRPLSSGWLHTYTKVCANSAYTADWVRRWWKVPSEVLYPPVTQQPVGRKEPMILSVGRFFDPERGHSKKQLEMVRAFHALCRNGLEGWSLHLVGGCDKRDRVYLERVRHAIGEAPVYLHVAAPGAELRDLYSRAAIYWHAAGLGEDPDEHPERFEHFGITTVEAMSAGAVPVVIGAAGQAEVVRDGIDGMHFHTLDELVTATLRLVRDDQLRRRLSESARARAAEFSWEVFSENVKRHAEETLRKIADTHRSAARPSQPSI
ncbi:MAG: hypothetical protein KatS3mg008_2128 [Acidimicrobiales bacterium]|nr:MAG: hypothetical protein KatS3mg008_2128 [Acidimicrobiales bacterium]